MLTIDLEITSGTSFPQPGQQGTFVYKVDGEPYDFTGCALLTAQIRKAIGESVIGNVGVTFGSNGEFSLDVPYDVCTQVATALGKVKGVWDVLIQNAAGRRIRMAYGRVTAQAIVSVVE